MLTLLAVPLAYVNPRMGRSFNLVAAAFLYMLYSNCLNIVQSLIAQGKLGFWIGLALPHSIALARRRCCCSASSFRSPASSRRAAGRRAAPPT